MDPIWRASFWNNNCHHHYWSGKVSEKISLLTGTINTGWFLDTWPSDLLRERRMQVSIFILFSVLIDVRSQALCAYCILENFKYKLYTVSLLTLFQNHYVENKNACLDCNSLPQMEDLIETRWSLTWFKQKVYQSSVSDFLHFLKLIPLNIAYVTKCVHDFFVPSRSISVLWLHRVALHFCGFRSCRHYRAISAFLTVHPRCNCTLNMTSVNYPNWWLYRKITQLVQCLLETALNLEEKKNNNTEKHTHIRLYFWNNYGLV